jgi:cyclophilin family peptidyl-prolyl cis-trans isomerase
LFAQTGDPTNQGDGGESIWGEEFKDEIHQVLHSAGSHSIVNVLRTTAKGSYDKRHATCGGADHGRDTPAFVK